MKLHRLEGRSKTGLAQFGCLWPEGELQRTDHIIAKDEQGKILPMQSRITAFYKNGSVKWTAHASLGELLGDEFYVEKGEEISPVALPALRVDEHEIGWKVVSEDTEFFVHKVGGQIVSDMKRKGKNVLNKLYSVLHLESRDICGDTGEESRYVTNWSGEIKKTKLEEFGPIRVIFKIEGVHTRGEEEKIPFILRLIFGVKRQRLDFQYTFFYDGNEEKDFLKGIGLRTEIPAAGKVYNRHIRFLGDAGSFSESAANLLTWRPAIPLDLYRQQCAGNLINPIGEVLDKVNTVIKAMPFWDEYELVQDAPTHFKILKKQKGSNLCYLECQHGMRAQGGLAFGSEAGGLMISIRDFWKKYPSGYSVQGLTDKEITATAWFYSPQAEAFDFRHYAERGYNQSYYEGYDFKGASAYGIGVTSECSFELTEEMCASEDKLSLFTESVDSPALYFGSPEYYHKLRAFGYWSLKKEDTEVGRWLEAQLEKAVEFYKAEVDQRQWYGLFDYGDFMHTYDPSRHVWRYDMGGYAWDNTELVPTLWLWQMFLRTGKADVFNLAEKLSRHSSEVDVYHFGPYKGMGSRHNVRHWGCPCKEARIAMAAHHRYYYYMTGDHRLEDIFEELKDNEYTFLNKDPLGEFYDKDKMVYPSHARSGPDWSSLCSNWVTEWERTLNSEYLEKILIGSEDIEKAPLKLVSGPDFEFDPKSKHLRYIGERTTGGTHLQICMGAPSIWMEMADLLDDERWKKMIAEYGRFYYLPEEQKQKESEGIIGAREFSLPFMAAAMGAYGAWWLKDQWLAEETWRILLHALATNANVEGFEIQEKTNAGNQKCLKEIPWISTNFTAQWCLNVIMVLDFIPDVLPDSMVEMKRFIAEMPAESWRKA